MSEIFDAITRAGTTLENLEEADRALPAAIESATSLPRFAESTVTSSRVRDRAMRAVVRKESVASEQMRVVRAKVHTLEASFPFRCFGIVSPSRREGKTTVSFGLATALAQEDSQRVLLVEANLRSPRLASRLKLPAGPGLSEWLRGSEEEIVVRQVQPFGFWLLEGGERCDNPGDLLSHERMERLLERCRTEFDYVILDCTALTPVADAVVLQESLDGFLLVVRSRFTREDVVQRALTHLKKGSVKGVIFHAHRVIFR